MPDIIIGIDHIYLAVSDLACSERYYDTVMTALGFHKNGFDIDGDRHVQYYNRHFGLVLRPARAHRAHDPYAPGLHHLCLRAEDEAAVRAAAAQLRARGVEISEPRRYPECAPDYFSFFFSDPDGIRLEITNYRSERRRRHDRWDEDET